MSGPAINCACPGTVPIVSRSLALAILGRIPRWEAAEILKVAVAWLTEKHPGLEQYNGIQGRPHTDPERVAAGRELACVSQLPCPFLQGRSCILGGLPKDYRLFGKQPYSWLPMHVAKELSPETCKKMVKAGAVADAKSVYLNTNEVGLIALHSH